MLKAFMTQSNTEPMWAVANENQKVSKGMAEYCSYSIY